jgi:hypothetical protein
MPLPQMCLNLGCCCCCCHSRCCACVPTAFSQIANAPAKKDASTTAAAAATANAGHIQHQPSSKLLMPLISRLNSGCCCCCHSKCWAHPASALFQAADAADQPPSTPAAAAAISTADAGHVQHQCCWQAVPLELIYQHNGLAVRTFQKRLAGPPARLQTRHTRDKQQQLETAARPFASKKTPACLTADCSAL